MGGGRGKRAKGKKNLYSENNFNRPNQQLHQNQHPSNFESMNSSNPINYQSNHGSNVYQDGNYYNVDTHSGIRPTHMNEIGYANASLHSQDYQNSMPKPAPRYSVMKRNEFHETDAYSSRNSKTNETLWKDKSAHLFNSDSRIAGTSEYKAEKYASNKITLAGKDSFNVSEGQNTKNDLLDAIEIQGARNNSIDGNKGQGAKQKAGKKTKSQDNEMPFYFCDTCDKYIYKDISNHNSHSYSAIDLGQGFKSVMKEDLGILEGTERQVKTILKSNQQTNGVLNLWDNVICENLSEILQYLNAKCSQEILEINTLTKDIENIKQQKQNINFVEFQDLRKSAAKVIQEGENQISKAETIPFWLCFSWFKNSLGLMLVGGKTIYLTLSGSGDFASLNLQGDRILLSSFRSSLPTGKEAILLPYEVIKNILDRESALVFMKISYCGKDIGTAYIRVDSETTCGQQFLLLCTGEMGPSYLSNRFFRSCLKGKAGHHIWGGDYSKQNGTGGETVIGNGNSALSLNPKPIIKGLISSRFGYQDLNTIFRIYLTGNETLPSSSGLAYDQFGFGQVEDGLDALSYVANMNDITKTTIVDVGRVLSLG